MGGTGRGRYSLFGFGVEVSLADGASLFFSPPLLDAVSAFFSLLVPTVFDELPALSVLYQPEPLKTIGAGVMSLRTGPPHVGHADSGDSLNDCHLSNSPHVLHSYT